MIEANTDNTLPGLSAMCPTYGRVQMLEEAIQSFLLQDYPGPKELIILNDLPEQTLHFEHPEVKIFNVSKRITALGKKCTICAHLASYDWLLPWDDDDISLPHRMRYSMQQIQAQNLSFYRINRVWLGIGGTIKTYPGIHPSACYRRDLFNQIGGYANIDSGYDKIFEFACRNLRHTTVFEISFEEMYYFYRWSGQPTHISVHFQRESAEVQQEINRALNSGRDIPPAVLDKMHFDPGAEVRNDVLRRIQEGSEPSGEIHLNPRWRADYVALCKEAIQYNTEKN